LRTLNSDKLGLVIGGASADEGGNLTAETAVGIEAESAGTADEKDGANNGVGPQLTATTDNINEDLAGSL
jgi:hypothetical protein